MIEATLLHEGIIEIDVVTFESAAITGKSTFIIDPVADSPALRFNDAIVDRQGRVLAGTMNQEDLYAPDGALFRLDPDGAIHELATGLAVANGIGLSPDGETLYVTDMFNSRLLAYDYDKTDDLRRDGEVA